MTSNKIANVFQKLTGPRQRELLHNVVMNMWERAETAERNDDPTAWNEIAEFLSDQMGEHDAMVACLPDCAC
jgi:hypothetical protein